ncbi:protein RFT1 homolog isoform X2 [Orussus abietinus]|uniref:protein RFT1 homolog isoform X2 n=1 Tax=Orussus abietinus TaxID=222816 RepID=UPI000625B663|nr:protein RFT1 homolog isoform X2 [Orussus abietinus]
MGDVSPLVPICFVMSSLFGYIWLYVLTTAETLPPYYTFAVCAVAVSCIIELSSLVIQLVASAFLFVRLKIILDTIMIALRTLTFVPMILYQPENALLAFGIAQLVAAVFYTASHYAYFHYYIKKNIKSKPKRKMSLRGNNDEIVVKEFPFTSVKDFLPGQLENYGSCLDRKLTILTWSFFKQGFLKQVLTEGERLIMTIVPVLTFAEQGTYEVVNNLGSLAARFIFRPIEDSGYFYFTQMVKRDKPLSDQNPLIIQESVKVLTYLCSTVMSIGLVGLVFGQSYSSVLLWLYGGEKLISYLPVLLLRTHCLAILLMGINGVTECYTNATADSATINKNNLIMIYESITFLVSSYIFATWFGPVGFILGNCINMSLRILHSCMFITKRHLEINCHPLRGLIPKPVFSGSLIAAAIVTKLSHDNFFPEDKRLHVFVGVVMLIVVLITWLYENQDLVKLGIKEWYNWRNTRRKGD